MNWKTVIAAGAAFLFAGAHCIVGTTAVQAGAPPGGHLNIDSVHVDFGSLNKREIYCDK